MVDLMYYAIYRLLEYINPTNHDSEWSTFWRFMTIFITVWVTLLTCAYLTATTLVPWLVEHWG